MSFEVLGLTLLVHFVGFLGFTAVSYGASSTLEFRRHDAETAVALSFLSVGWALALALLAITVALWLPILTPLAWLLAIFGLALLVVTYVLGARRAYQADTPYTAGMLAASFIIWIIVAFLVLLFVKGPEFITDLTGIAF